MMSTENTIHLVGDYRLDEALAAAEVKPGHLVEETSAAINTVQKHSTALGAAVLLFAIEDAWQGNTKTDAYAAGARVMMSVEVSGNEVQGYIQAGESVTKGDLLESAGDGTFQKLTTGVALAAVRETLDLSGSGAVDTLARIRVL
jgi:hypothetical protein